MLPHQPAVSETFVSNEIAELQRVDGLTLTVLPLRSKPRDRRVAAQAMLTGLPLLGERDAAFGPPLTKAKVLALARRARTAHQSAEQEVFHAPFINEPATVACLLARRTGAVCTSSAHAADYQLQAPASLTWNLNHLDHVFPISQGAAAALRAAEPAISDRLTIVRASVTGSLSQLPLAVKPADGPKRIVIIARLVEKKGIDQAIKLLPLLAAAGIRAQLDIVGDGPCRADLEQLSASLGLQQQIQFRGELPHSQAIEILRSGDLALLPARPAASGDEDGIPVFLMEAALLGVPFVSTAVGGIVELVPDGTSFLAPSGDAASLAPIALRLLTDPPHAAKVRTSVKTHAMTEFDPRRQAEKLVHTWLDLVSRRSHNRAVDAGPSTRES